MFTLELIVQHLETRYGTLTRGTKNHPLRTA